MGLRNSYMGMFDIILYLEPLLLAWFNLNPNMDK